jgi:hypothetical protein
MTHKSTPHDRPVPPTSELFNKPQLIQRHPHILNQARVEWALRHRDTNGLGQSVFDECSAPEACKTGTAAYVRSLLLGNLFKLQGI